MFLRKRTGRYWKGEYDRPVSGMKWPLGGMSGPSGEVRPLTLSLSGPRACFLGPLPSSAWPASLDLFRKRGPGLLLGGGRGSTPRILWICRNANKRRACWRQTARQHPSPGPLAWGRHRGSPAPCPRQLPSSNCHAHPPTGTKNHPGSRAGRLTARLCQGAPWNSSASRLTTDTPSPASPTSALIMSNLILSIKGSS